MNGEVLLDDGRCYRGYFSWNPRSCPTYSKTQSFNSFPGISHKAGLLFPRETFILCDKIYPCRYPLFTGFTAAQIRTQPPLERERRVIFNENVKIHRVYIEHVIGQMKCLKVIGPLYRHSK